MGKEARIKVRLDTSQAKGDLRSLTKDAAAAAGRVGGGLRRAAGRGLGAVGLGGALGVGLGAVRGATQSGIGDVVGEAFGGTGARLAETIFGDLDEKARADKAAREETIQAFKSIAGATGTTPPGTVNYFNQIRALRLEEEKGREILERDERLRGAGPKALADQVVQGFNQVVIGAVLDLKAWFQTFK